MRYICMAALIGLTAASFGQDLTVSEFESTPAFTETFAGGTPVGQWVLDSNGNTAVEGAATPATYATVTPPGVDATVTNLDPVGSSSDQGVMVQGNPSSTNGSAFGLNYMRCLNSLADGSGDDFTTVPKFRIKASLFLYSTADRGSGIRWQVGPYVTSAPASNLFMPAAYYNTDSTGGGPGFGQRGAASGNSALPGTSALTTSRWTLMSVMVDMSDVDSANWRLAICVDANGDSTLDEADPLEYFAGALDPTKLPGSFGTFTVGEVNSDNFPLFVDTVDYYLPVTSAVHDFTLY